VEDKASLRGFHDTEPKLNGTATITATACDGTSFTYSYGAAVQGSTVAIQATGAVAGVTGGTYTVTATYGTSVSLVNANAKLGANMNVPITVLFTNYGTMTTTMFPVPANGNVAFTINMPVPSISGAFLGSLPRDSSRAS
jgi:hypothetical protein